MGKVYGTGIVLVPYLGVLDWRSILDSSASVNLYDGMTNMGQKRKATRMEGRGILLSFFPPPRQFCCATEMMHSIRVVVIVR
eukprot:scaffold11185_cov205-Amphora_coffeaeformis.AAC.4